MKFAAIAFATLALLAGAGADVKSYVKACYAKADQDLLNKNINAFEKLLRVNVTPDFKSTDMGQTEDFGHMVADIRSSFVAMQHISTSTTQITKVVMKGNKATFTTRRAMGGDMSGPDGKSHKLMLVGNSTDVWVRVGGSWKMKSMTWSNEKTTMDGKAVSLSAPPPKPSK